MEQYAEGPGIEPGGIDVYSGPKRRGKRRRARKTGKPLKKVPFNYIIAETTQAMLYAHDIEGNIIEFWVPKSVGGIHSDGCLWVAHWFEPKEVR